jgi:hypothetical protein
MKAIIDVLGKRLEILLDGVNFRSDFDRALGSPEHLLEIGEHNLREYEKMETMSEERYERIQNLYANILASALQEEAIKHYGDADHDSIRQVLYGWFNRPEDRVFQDKLREAGRQALLGLGHTKELCTSVLVNIYDKLPDMLMYYIEELIEPMHMLPLSEAQPIAMALADMLKGVENDNYS